MTCDTSRFTSLPMAARGGDPELAASAVGRELAGRMRARLRIVGRRWLRRIPGCAWQCLRAGERLPGLVGVVDELAIRGAGDDAIPGHECLRVTHAGLRTSERAIVPGHSLGARQHDGARLDAQAF